MSNKWNVFKDENWLGTVLANSHEDAVRAANANPDFTGWTTVEERGSAGNSGAQ